MRIKSKGNCLLPIVLVLCGLLAGCGNKEAAQSMTNVVQEPNEAAQEQKEPVSDSSYEDTPAKEDPEEEPMEASQEKVDSMKPLFHMINGMLIQEKAQYDGEDPEFYWSLIGRAINDCGPFFGPLYEEKDSQGFLNRIAVGELEDVLFPNIKSQPAIPASVKEFVWYDNNKDAYGCILGDAGDVETVIMNYEAGEDGTVTVYADYNAAGEESTLGSFVYRLSANGAADPFKTPVYYYRIEDVAYTSYLEDTGEEAGEVQAGEDAGQGPAGEGALQVPAAEGQEGQAPLAGSALFGSQIKDAVALGDMGALAAVTAYPLAMKNGTTINSAEEFAALAPQSILTPELTSAMATADPSVMVKNGDSYMLGSGVYNIWFREAGDGFQIIGINN